MSEDKPECQTCNGSGLEAPRTICRDCEEPFADYLDNGNSGPVAARPSPTGEKVEAVAWTSEEQLEWLKKPDGMALIAATEHNTVKLSDPFDLPFDMPLYSAATLAALVAERDEARALIRWAHDTLYEINPSNYDHDEVCKLNDASVEVILGLASMLSETHGKTKEWWDGHRFVESSLATANARVERLEEAFRIATDALDGLSYIHDGNPSDAMADMPPVDYARHMLYEARQLAREAVAEARAVLTGGEDDKKTGDPK